jgi:hypothetical protein
LQFFRERLCDVHRSCCLKKGVIPSLSNGSGSAWWNVDDPSLPTRCCNIVTLLGLMPFLLSLTLPMGILKLGIASSFVCFRCKLLLKYNESLLQLDSFTLFLRPPIQKLWKGIPWILQVSEHVRMEETRNAYMLLV